MAVRDTLAAFGACLAYPGARLEDALRRLRRSAGEDEPGVRESVAAFTAEARRLGPDALCETYTRTFDLQPSCCPYLGVHLFGDESFKRSRLLTGLAEAYARSGHDAGGELPDHVAVVLRWVPVASDEEWADLARCCLAGPLQDMATALEHSGNPYRHLLAAAARMVRAEVESTWEVARG